MSRKLHNILITGGAGFIGSNFIHYLSGMSSAEGNLFDDANLWAREPVKTRSKAECFHNKPPAMWVRVKCL